MKYHITGDRTGTTYGIYEQDDNAPPLSGKMIESGIKSLMEAVKRVEELEKKNKVKIKMGRP